MTFLNFELSPLPPEVVPLREDVRAFLRESLRDWTPARRAESWDGFDPEFSRKLGAKG